MEIITLPLLLRWVGALLLTLSLMLLCIYLLQNGKDKLSRNATARRLKKLESLALNRTTTVHLVEADDNTFLVTTDPNGTHLHMLKSTPQTIPFNPIARSPK